MNLRRDDHLDDSLLSALLDDQVEAAQVAAARAHLRGCSECEQRLADLQAVVGLLHALPMHEPPRAFVLDRTTLAEPSNVVRLQRWYTTARVAAASLAAVFVCLLAGTLYVDATAVRSPGTSSLASAPAAAPAVTAAVAPAAAPAAAPTPQAAAPRAAASVKSGGSTDQVAATTSVRPLPTLAPPPAAPQGATAPAQASASPDPAGAWRLAATGAGILTFLALFLALGLRRRLRSLDVIPAPE